MFKIIIAGCGMVSDMWFNAILNREDTQIVGIVARTEKSAKAKKEQFNLTAANTYTHISDALKNEKADIVVDLTPPELHYETVTLSLRAGCHVFGEKPMSNTLETAEEMVKCSDETGKEYFLMQNRRYLPHLYALKNFLQDKNLGQIGQISANFQLNPHFGGFRDEMDSPLIADMAIHTFDAARFISGKNPVSVYCSEFNPVWSWYKGDANAICIFTMEDGSVFDYRGSWCANGINTSWESEWRIACENGCAFWDGAKKLYFEEVDKLVVKTGLADEESDVVLKDITPLEMETQGHAACITEMFEALITGKRPQTDCRDNINSIRMVYKALESSKENQLVKF